jgi:hypothetical protein
MLGSLRTSLLRTLAFHETWNHAPTIAEWIATLEFDESVPRDDAWMEVRRLLEEGIVLERFGRCVFPESASRIEEQRLNELFAPRKRRTAYRVASWLACLSGVRFVALCNTASLGHARDESDLDFFVITRAGMLMQTRALAALPFKLLGRRPGAKDERDAVCLSYFVSDADLSLRDHMLTPDDPYFRYWFLSLLPLYDDGVSTSFWNENSEITKRHPFAASWHVPPDFCVRVPGFRIPTIRALESFADRAQRHTFPSTIREHMNRDTRVIVNDRVLKMHVVDGREDYRQKYQETLEKRGLV